MVYGTAAALEGWLILVVEDQDTLREGLLLQLSTAGAAGVGCRSAEEMADRLAAGVLPDLVLLDLTLPGRDGLAALRGLREDARWCDLPVVVITADDEDDVIDDAMGAGCDAYLAKPVRLVQLIEICGRAVAARKAA